MDFSFTEEQEALRALARKIFDDLATHELIRAAERDSDWLDRALWTELAKAKLLGVALPESVGGSGLGLVELFLLLEEVGHAAAPVPVYPTLVLGALPLAEFGTREQQHDLLPGVADGDTILTAALLEPDSEEPTAPETEAKRKGGAWRLDGVKTCVPMAHLAERILVPARTGTDAIGVFLIDRTTPGVSLQRQDTTSGEPQLRMVLDRVSVPDGSVLGDPERGREIVEWLVDRAVVALCAMQTGVADRALRMTAEYTSRREQFGKKLATFQAVAQRAADAYIDVEAIRWTMWQAAWRLSAGLPAREEIATAKFWASEAGHRVTYAAQHLHGGIGLDLDYPVHRYYLWSKQIELTLGSATRHLVKLGDALAEEEAEARSRR